MRNVNVLGIVFPNRFDDCLGGLTAHRSLGSVPFGGRYRLIDFVLSNMVNAGIGKVQLSTKSNYHSLMDHIGAGKAWDLDRKNGGLYFMPTNVSDEAYEGRIAELHEMVPFLRRCSEVYVLLADCHVVGNVDYSALIRHHEASGADVTVAYRNGRPPQHANNLQLAVNADGAITDLCIGADEKAADDRYALGLYVIGRERLIRLVEAAYSRGQGSFERDILQRRPEGLSLCGYEVPEYTVAIHSISSYFDANMALLEPTVRRQLFLPDRRIYTKVRDSVPARYGLHAQVSDSLVADGTVVEGQVSHCLLFRDVVIGAGAVLENCIVMQGGVIRQDARLRYVLSDKNVKMRENSSLQGAAGYPMYVKKGAEI